MSALSWPRSRFSADLSGGVIAAVMVAPLLINGGAVATQPLGSAGLGVQAAFAAAILGGLICGLLGGPPLRPFAPKIPYAAVIAALAATAVAHPAVAPIAAADPVHGAALALAACAAAVALAGIAQTALGYFGLGAVVKYTPYPVIAGLIDGFAVAIGLSQAPALFGVADWSAVRAALVDPAWGLLSPLAAGLTAALGSIAVARWIPKAPATLSGLALGTGAHHLLAALVATPPGPIVGAPPVGSPFTFEPGLLVELYGLGALTALAPAILGAAATLTLIASLGALINAAAAEALFNQRVDGDRELRDLGLIHLACGVLGGLPGSGSPLSMRAMHRQGAGGRAAYLAFAAAFALLALALGAVLDHIPTAALAGVILAEIPGYFDPWTKGMLRDWRQGRASASVKRNLAVAVGVSGLTLWIGPLNALGIGFAAALWTYMTQASGLAVRRVTSGAVVRSKTARPTAVTARLARDGDAFALIELQGAIFFGSADAMARQVETAAAQRRRVILDLRRVVDVDGSGAVALSRMDQRLEQAGVIVTLAGIAPDSLVAQSLINGGWRAPFADGRVYATTDAALAAAEDALLAADTAGPHDAAELDFEQLDLLQTLEPAAVATLRAVCQRQIYLPDERIITDGDDGHALHLLASGRVSVVKRLEDGRALRLADLTPGVCFGEMALLTGERRTADVVADDLSVCWSLTRAAVEGLIETDPAVAAGLMRAVARVLAGRLGAANSWLRELEK